MNQTQTRHERTSDSIEILAPSDWNDARATIRRMATEPGFIHALAEKGLRPTDRTTADYADILSWYGEQYCEAAERAGTTEQSEIDQVKLLANVPYYLHNQKQVARFDDIRKSRRLTDEEWTDYQEHKPYMVWYNQLLSDYAYAHPDDKMSSMNKELIEQAVTCFPREAQTVENHVKRATRGARTDAASRQLLDRTSLNYVPGSIEDDLRGGDMIVERHGKRIKIDIKSSLGDIAAIRGGYDAIQSKLISYAILKNRRDNNDKEKHVVVLFPGFTDSDLKDSLGLNMPEKDMQNRADFIEHQLELAFRELGV